MAENPKKDRIEKLLGMVVQKPLKEKPSAKPACPHCGSKGVETHGMTTTLVGGGNGPDDNPNHTWTGCFCKVCEKSFTRETKSGNVWYTREGEVKDAGGGIMYHERLLVKGIPSCFEAYVYGCRCGGKITRRQTEMDGKAPTNGSCTYSIKDGVSTAQFRTFYSCDKCGKTIEPDFEHWDRGLAKVRYNLAHPRKWAGKLKLGWTITEEIGSCIINDYAVAKIHDGRRG